jgi:hypothetical protein
MLCWKTYKLLLTNGHQINYLLSPFWELCARGCVGRCARVVVDHVRTRDEAASYNASELWSVNWYSNLRQYLRWITLYCDDAECVETKSSDKNIVSHQIGVGTRGHELAIEINLQKRGYQWVCFFSSYRETAVARPFLMLKALFLTLPWK